MFSNSRSTSTASVLFLLLTNQQVTSQSIGNSCAWQALPLSFRIPPVLASHNTTSAESKATTSWTSTPAGWLYGAWQVRYSSRLYYQNLWNFEADTYPTLPSNGSVPRGRNADLTSFNLRANTSTDTAADDRVHTVFGYDDPRPLLGADVWHFQGTGSLVSVANDWMVLGWGYDQEGVAWRAEYETAVEGDEPCINVLSRSPAGPDEQTLQSVRRAMRDKFEAGGYADLVAYVANLTELPRNGNRKSQGPPACDIGCMMND